MSRSTATATTGSSRGVLAPVFLPDGSQVFTGVHNEWAAKIGGGYRFNDGLGDLQLNAYYEWIRREVTPRSSSRSTSVHVTVCSPALTQYIGKMGGQRVLCPRLQDPRQPGLSELKTSTPVACAARSCRPVPGQPVRRFRQPVCGRRSLLLQQLGQLVLVGIGLTQGPGAHYCLGAERPRLPGLLARCRQRHDRRRDHQGGHHRHDVQLLSAANIVKKGDSRESPFFSFSACSGSDEMPSPRIELPAPAQNRS